MIKCLAIDDEPLALQQVAAYIRKIPFLELAGECQSAIEAKLFLENDTVDAIFCDINMPDLNGMDFVRSLAAPPIIVFTTAYSEYAIEGYKVDAIDYLLKPFGLDDFKRAANKIKERIDVERLAYSAQSPQGPEQQNVAVANGERDDTIFIKTEYKVVRISISSIRYIEGMSEYLRIYLEGQPKPIITLLSMKKMEERLPEAFMRIHRSYIVNLTKIREVNKNRVIMDADTYLPIGDMYKEGFNRFISTKFLGK
jgi:DNA-binding LytR/AlgR family response regulator